jgi:hypothetical protein
MHASITSGAARPRAIAADQSERHVNCTKASADLLDSFAGRSGLFRATTDQKFVLKESNTADDNAGILIMDLVAR